MLELVPFVCRTEARKNCRSGFATAAETAMRRTDSALKFDRTPRGPLDNRVIACFEHYLTLEGHSISRANAEGRMLKKLSQSLTEDIAPLLPAGVTFTDDDAIAAFGRVWENWSSAFQANPGSPLRR
jgi:hypothetical protein